MPASVTKRVAELLGTKEVHSSLQFVPMLRKGLRYSALERTGERGGLSPDEVVEALGLPRRTLARRKQEGVLSPSESERVMRLARVIERAADVIGGGDRANEWLRKPNKALGGESPLSLLDTDVGAQEVEDVLGRIEYGVYT